MADDDTKWRVKVYVLNNELQWEEKGVGHAACQESGRLRRMSIYVVDENTDEVLLDTPILPNTSDGDVYKKQQDTLLVWEEPDGKDLALSFQEKEGCDDMLERIQIAQASIKPVLSDDDGDVFFDDDLAARLAEPSIPEIELGNLPGIADALGSPPPTKFMRDRLAKGVLTENVIPKLLELFHQCEDLEDDEGLGHIFTAFKGMFTLNETVVTDALCKSDSILDVVGVLEYNPALRERQQHRKFLTEQAVFKEIIPLRDPAVIALIHHTYRLQYLRDVILPCILDDPTSNTLASQILFNNVSIITHLRSDTEFLDELFKRLSASNVKEEDRTQLLGFLGEFLTLGKELPAEARAQMLKDLIGRGMLDSLQQPLLAPSLPTRQSAAVALSLIIQQDVSAVRRHILASARHDEGAALLHALVSCFARETELGMITHLGELIRPLMDTENMDAASEKQAMLRILYEDCAETLLSPLLQLPPANEKAATKYISERGAQLYALLELLTAFVPRHGPMLRSYWLRSAATGKIAQVVGCGRTYLVLGALRLVRALVALKDEACLKQLIKSGTYGAIVQQLVDNGPKYNMLNSSIIELFEYIRKENVKPTIKHIVESHGEQLREVEYVSTFKEFCLRYEQNEDTSMLDPLADMDSEDLLQRARQERLLSDEENWFDNDDEEDKKETSSQASSSQAVDSESQSAGSSEEDSIVLRLPVRRPSSPDDEDEAAVIGLFKHRKEPRTRHNSGSDSSDSESSSDSGPAANHKTRISITSLVDYGDDDSDEDVDQVPDAKRPRIGTSD